MTNAKRIQAAAQRVTAALNSSNIDKMDLAGMMDEKEASKIRVAFKKNLEFFEKRVTGLEVMGGGDGNDPHLRLSLSMDVTDDIDSHMLMKLGKLATDLYSVGYHCEFKPSKALLFVILL